MVNIGKEKLRPPRGMRDFLPKEMAQRQYIHDTIRRVYEVYGFLPIDTPALEHYEVLSAKCGHDTMEQIYRFKDKSNRDLGLRYDLTVSTARLVATNPALPRPFKRYMISRAWRYENPQLGRYREFWQADIDIFGVASMDAEVELLAAAIQALKALGFKNFNVRINNRKILTALMEHIGVPARHVDIVFRIIDKLDKLKRDELTRQLLDHLEPATVEKIMKLLGTHGPAHKIIEIVRGKLGESRLGLEGIEEIEAIYTKASAIDLAEYISIDLSLVRGLNYYTGPIFEITLKGHEDLGSLAGGGRYDNLVETLGGPKTPAAGISLGVERLWSVMDRLKLFKNMPPRILVYIAPISPDTSEAALKICQRIREAQIPAMFNLMRRKLKKILQIANDQNIPFVIL
ncbi:MAG: histidine--tRNA ligase, partial [Candidatus Ranarchaeia archaeon]